MEASWKTFTPFKTQHGPKSRGSSIDPSNSLGSGLPEDDVGAE